MRSLVFKAKLQKIEKKIFYENKEKFHSLKILFYQPKVTENGAEEEKCVVFMKKQLKTLYYFLIFVNFGAKYFGFMSKRMFLPTANSHFGRSYRT